MKPIAAKIMSPNATSSCSATGATVVPSRTLAIRRALTVLGGAAAIALSLLVAPAIADFDPPPSGDGGSDPTVGTLPTYGDSRFEGLDQTVTLRGSFEDVRAAFVSATGHGAIEAIDLGEGDVWIRYYGDIALSLNLAELADVEVSIFTGFEGEGLTYSIGQANGFGEARSVGVGSDIRLDPLRFKLSGLLDDTLFVAGLHQTGARTMTSLEFLPVDGVVVIRQDI